jgi:DNA polymerase-3 subunit alpha
MKITSIEDVTNNDPTFIQVKSWFDKHLATEVIDFDDQKVYENVYHQASTRSPGVFQLTSRGAQKLFEKGKPRSLVEIATLTSIFRPGPLAAHVDKLYLENKANPHSIDYRHPLIKKVLEPTSNCIIFQEQLMELCHVVAGFPKSECDKVRKNILKRQGGNPEESMKKAKAMKDSFVQGSVGNGVKEETASKLWDDILFFAGYGFNLCFTPDTEVNTFDKEGEFLATKQIQHIDSNEFVMSRDEATGENIFVEVVQRHDRGVQEVYEVTLDTGATVKCTMGHKFRTTDGRMISLRQIINENCSIVVNVANVSSNQQVSELTKQNANSRRSSTASLGSNVKSAASLESRWESISAALTN